MANCVNCGGSTSLFVSERPVCLKCDESSPEERQERQQQRSSDAPVPGVAELVPRSVDEILRTGVRRSGRRPTHSGSGFSEVRALYRLASLNSAT
jgi:hypothetical protein